MKQFIDSNYHVIVTIIALINLGLSLYIIKTK